METYERTNARYKLIILLLLVFLIIGMFLSSCTHSVYYPKKRMIKTEHGMVYPEQNKRINKTQ